MMNSLDLLVIVSLFLLTFSALALALMFLVRNNTIRIISFYTVAAISVYTASIGLRISQWFFPFQTFLGFAAIAIAVAAIVLELLSKKDARKFTIARITATASLLIGIMSALV